ncbi:MAG: hypothetical protein VX796_09285 [Pseudomonadota bacterium]|nr:hypothetical protein [Pseudomonadota bacterium]
MKVLVACEYSGVVRDAFLRRGYFAMSCDLLPTESPGPHYEGDVRDVLGYGWDLMIAHPDCTYLCSSGLHWNKRVPGREEKTLAALDFVRLLMSAPIKRKAIENPVGRIGSAIRPASQYIQPYEYGHDASKRTCLWLEGLPPLVATSHVPGRVVGYRANGKPIERWSNQTDSGQNRLSPSADRWKERARTYEGWADAMAEQWGPIVWAEAMKVAA